jgi:hypothetical protein
MVSDFYALESNSFKLIETYEIQFNLSGWNRCVRYEIFVSIKNISTYRARVYLDEQYNLYTYLLNSNTDVDGNALNKMHNVDMLNRDITTLLPIGDELLNGKTCYSLEEFINYMHPEVASLIAAMQ